MADPFVPEADAAEQRREVVSTDADPEETGPPGDRSTQSTSERALAYPDERPLEADDADVLEQSQPADTPEDDWR